MKRLAFAALIASAILSAPAMAQQSTSGSQSQAIAIAGGNGNDGSVQRSRQRIASTAAAIAPGLTAAGVHSCAGSVTAAGGFVGGGFSLGGTYEMVECNRRAYAATLQGMGQNLAALALVCNNAEVKNALNLTGVTCPQQEAERVAAVAAAPAPRYAPSDYRGSQGSTSVPPRSGSVQSWSALQEAPAAPLYKGQPIVQTATPWRD